MTKPVMLVILDGWGHRAESVDNAVALARTPNFDALWAACPRNHLRTSGLDVGLPPGQMGNSEVGHLNIGAGRVVMQDLPRIDAAIADGSLGAMPPLADFIARMKAGGGTAHLVGLISAGGVHSHQRHALALARLLDEAGIPVALHAWTDGRDTAPRAAGDSLAVVAQEFGALKHARIATITGRYFAMDRDHRWERVEQAWRAMVLAEGNQAESADAAIRACYAADKHDEFLPASVLPGHTGMADGDGILCFNFRADRVRQILAALLDPAFTGFARPRAPRFAAALGLVEYSRELNPLIGTIFPPQSMEDILGAVVSAAGRTQLHMAETEKYPHVTYFLNGGEEVAFDGETRIMVPSPKVATYDLQPEMSAPELTAKAVEAIASGAHELIVLNFANADMVGHTGSLSAAIRACEAVDRGLGAIADAVRAQGGALMVTADHGNAELMRDPANDGPHTSHTTNPVPVLLMGGPEGAVLREGRLGDIAPTLLALMGLPQPAAMTGRSLLA
ncbi:2,3-bisphosphoglycerate-independent phosphoglycerate mutase [Roseococcus suduntuyensis]|uniref:2,3-bisphosphoglycerate-independent phosphoglycerate mutase n=1 Tax=Roseococcus suduntuyensis TaxID=455361 RepID=A0A840A904_9PROT|nr:2,3-bisphosphoglycerate-independent phosphoglycerate mutase [Roseococcus suduntuyensis]MBB3897352.1 2,3-bisphosphoglycerate-independent phosphoglycerate mutase [Roseococcus suduntuyensis]